MSIRRPDGKIDWKGNPDLIYLAFILMKYERNEKVEVTNSEWQDMLKRVASIMSAIVGERIEGKTLDASIFSVTGDRDTTKTRLRNLSIGLSVGYYTPKIFDHSFYFHYLNRITNPNPKTK